MCIAVICYIYYFMDVIVRVDGLPHAYIAAEITLSGEEILHEGNIWLVTQEDGQKLDEESGPFMLVVNEDEFSTRWAKNVVRIKVK